MKTFIYLLLPMAVLTGFCYITWHYLPDPDMYWWGVPVVAGMVVTGFASAIPFMNRVLP